MGQQAKIFHLKDDKMAMTNPEEPAKDSVEKFDDNEAADRSHQDENDNQARRAPTKSTLDEPTTTSDDIRRELPTDAIARWDAL